MRLAGCITTLASALCLAAVGGAQQALVEVEHGPQERTIKRDVPYVPTPQDVVDKMLRLADIDGDDLLYDLGSGDGRIVITAAERYGTRGVGVDIDPERIAESWANAEAAGVTDKVEFIEGDLFEMDLSEATAVTLYLLTAVNLKLRPKLLEELRPGTPVVSHAFSMGEWQPDRVEHMGVRTVYLWHIPADVDGHWSVQIEGPDGDHHLELTLEQEFQKLNGGEARMGEHAAQVREGSLSGEEISFTLSTDGVEWRAPHRFYGRVEGDTMHGETDDASTWTAYRSALPATLDARR